MSSVFDEFGDLDAFARKVFERTGEDISGIVNDIKFYSKDSEKIEKETAELEAVNAKLRKERDDLRALLAAVEEVKGLECD